MFKPNTYEAGSASVTESLGVTLAALNFWVGDALPVLLVLWHHTYLNDTSGGEIIGQLTKCSVSSAIHVHWQVLSYSRLPQTSFLLTSPACLFCKLAPWSLPSCNDHNRRESHREKMKAMCHSCSKGQEQLQDRNEARTVNLVIRIRPAHYLCTSLFLLRIFLQTRDWLASYWYKANLTPYCLSWNPCSAMP